jgi:hypothetical protein
VRGGGQFLVVDSLQSREIVSENFDELGGMSRGMPGGESFCINR